MIELLLIAAVTAGGGASTTITVATVLMAIFGLITILAGFVFGRSYLKNQGVKGQLAAKDEIIKTNRQTIEALEGRLEGLETDMVRIETMAKAQQDRIGDLEKSLAIAETRYEELKKYAAPDAMAHIEEQLVGLNSGRDLAVHEILTRLTDIEARIPRPRRASDS